MTEQSPRVADAPLPRAQRQRDPGQSSRVRRIGVGVVGVVVLAAGVVMLVLPGPGALVVVGGLAVLASEFDWARRWLDTARDKAQTSAEKSAASRLSVALALVGAALLGAAAVICFTDKDFGVPLVAAVNSPLTGAFLLLSGLLVAGLTLWQRRKLVTAGRRGEGPLARG